VSGRTRVEAKVYLTPELARELEAMSVRLRRPKSQIVNAALASFVTNEGQAHLEGALAKRLDRLSRQVERLERDLQIANEALGLFVKAWLTATPPLAEEGRTAAELKGRERYSGFLRALGRRLADGPRLSAEVSEERPDV